MSDGQKWSITWVCKCVLYIHLCVSGSGWGGLGRTRSSLHSENTCLLWARERRSGPGRGEQVRGWGHKSATLVGVACVAIRHLNEGVREAAGVWGRGNMEMGAWESIAHRHMVFQVIGTVSISGQDGVRLTLTSENMENWAEYKTAVSYVPHRAVQGSGPHMWGNPRGEL